MSNAVASKRKTISPLQSLRQAEGSEEHLPVSVWLRLMKCHNLIFRELRKAIEKDDRITLPQFDVLVQLSRQNEGLSFINLSRRLLVTSGNLTGIVDRLEREGFVVREPDTIDRRIVYIHLTRKGKDLIGSVVPEHVRMIDSIFMGFSVKELRQLRELLGKLKAVFAERTG